MKKLSSVLWGIVLIALGVLLALNAFGIDTNIFFDGWWTLFIIIPSAISLITDRDKTGSFIGLGLGVILLLSCQEIIEFSMVIKLFVPFMIIVIGLRVLIGSIWKKNTDEVIHANVSNGNYVHNCSVVFSEQNINLSNQEFSGAQLEAVFGGIDYDLRNAIITQDCVINVKAIFGGINIFVPDNVNIKVNTTSLFGGVDNKKHGGITQKTATLYIDGKCLFGGVDIK